MLEEDIALDIRIRESDRVRDSNQLECGRVIAPDIRIHEILIAKRFELARMRRVDHAGDSNSLECERK